jgi:hypothetical protein
MGTLGGIGELAREVFGEKAGAPAPKPKRENTAARATPPALPGVPRVEG